MKKRILIISYEFPPLVGGSGTYSRELAVGLARIGSQVTVVTCNHKPAIDQQNTDRILEYQGISVLRFKAYGKLFFLQLSKFLKNQFCENFERRFDAIILSDSRSTRYAILNFTEEQFKKSIHIFHGGEVDSFYLKPNIRVKLSGIHRNFIPAMKKSAALVTVCNDLFELFKKEIPELRDKLTVILHGIDDNIFVPISREQRVSIRKKLGFSEKDILILSASRIVKEKGQDKLISAFKIIQKRNPNVSLIIVGNGEYRKELEKQVVELNIEKRIIFKDAMSRTDLAQIMAASDLYAMLSRRKDETFGLVYIEANACGIPVLGGNYAGVPESVEHGVSGLLADPFDVGDITKKLEKILNNEYRLLLGKSAYKRLKEGFTCEVMARNTLELIKKVSNAR